jgi:type IV pilus assembly protein PilF
MIRFACLVALALLTGCAEQPVTPELTPQPPETSQQADARTRADVHTQLGAGYFELRNFKVALDELNEALRADPNHGPAHNVLGLVYMELREDAKAQQSFERALRINEIDSDAHNNYGWFLCQRQRYDEAMTHFAAAVRNPLYRTPDKSYVNAGVCARQRGDQEAAVQYFERALSARPTQPQALYNLAEIAFERGEFKRSKDYLTRLNRTGTLFSAQALWLALRVERRLGDKEAEASYGVQLRKRFPESREAQALSNRQFE